MFDRWPGVSARGVLDGDAEALAGLCERRGPSVVGYCECVCGPERAVEAASAAFAAFRAGAARAPDLLAIDAEALLLGRTRASAAQRAPKPAAGLVYAEIPCSQVAALLAENATGSLTPADRDRLRRHLARCVSCRATQGTQHQAERAYFHPPKASLDPISRQEIIEALRRAVPLPTPNGAQPAPPAGPPLRQATVATPQPAAHKPPAHQVPQPSGPAGQVVPAQRPADHAGQAPRAAGDIPQGPQSPRKVPATGSSITSTRVGPSPAARPPTRTATPTGQPPTAQPAVADPAAAHQVAHPGAARPSTSQPALPGAGPPGVAAAPTTGGRPQAPAFTTVSPGRVASGPPTGGLARAGATPTPLEEQDTPPSGMQAVGWDSPTGMMSAAEIGAALDQELPADVDPEGHPEWSDDDAHADEGAGLDGGRRGPGRRLAMPLAWGATDRLAGGRVLAPAAVLVVGLVIALFVAGVFSGGGHHATGDSTGAQSDPGTTTIPATGGRAASGSGGDASTGHSPTVSATAAARERAARKRAEELARQRSRAGGQPSAKSKTSASSSAGDSATSAPTTAPGVSSTSAPASGAGGGSTVHELGTGPGTAPPVTGIPPATVNGYEPN